MKILFLILSFFFYFNAISQDTLLISNIDNNSENFYPPYIVGSYRDSTYKLEFRNPSRDEVVILPNGRIISGLGAIVNFKYDYIGGTLISGKKKTEIIDLVFYTEGTEVILRVVGKKFNREMTLSNSSLMELDNNHATIKTEGVGIWLIHKRV